MKWEIRERRGNKKYNPISPLQPLYPFFHILKKFEQGIIVNLFHEGGNAMGEERISLRRLFQDLRFYLGGVKHTPRSDALGRLGRLAQNLNSIGLKNGHLLFEKVNLPIENPDWETDLKQIIKKGFVQNPERLAEGLEIAEQMVAIIKNPQNELTLTCIGRRPFVLPMITLN